MDNMLFRFATCTSSCTTVVVKAAEEATVPSNWSVRRAGVRISILNGLVSIGQATESREERTTMHSGPFNSA